MRWLTLTSRVTAYAISLVAAAHLVIGFSLLGWPYGQLAQVLGKHDPDGVTAGELTAERGLEFLLVFPLLLVVAALVRLPICLAEAWLSRRSDNEVQAR